MVMPPPPPSAAPPPRAGEEKMGIAVGFPPLFTGEVLNPALSRVKRRGAFLDAEL
jgi:hypothetical protein